MSEYQYYGFLAVDRPLDSAAQKTLRAISSRAQITANRFTNEYTFDDFRGDPTELLTHWFDVHVYSGFWSSRHFALRLPKRLVDRASIERFQIDKEFMTIYEIRDSLLVFVRLYDRDIARSHNETAWLDELAPLRAAVLQGDMRLFYLLWLMQVGLNDFMRNDTAEPLPGIAPLTAGLEAMAGFLYIDPDLLAAAAAITPGADPATTQQAETFIRSLPDDEKVALLLQLSCGDDPHLGAMLRRRIQGSIAASQPAPPAYRTAIDLRAAAGRIAAARAQQDERRQEAALRQRVAEEAALAERRRAALTARGRAIWQDVEELILRRNALAYEQAVSLLLDLRDIIADPEDFARRIADIRDRHASKRNFMVKLDGAAMV